jgi:ketosteroid isomerase-like protein
MITPDTSDTDTDAAHLQLLVDFAAAWNRHDLPALMACMHTDAVFETAAGAQAHGSRHTGIEAVVKAFASAWEAMPDVQWRNGRHWVSGSRGVSEWTLTGTAADGTRTEVNGVDLFVFRDGKIALKDVFRKNRPALPPL